MKKFLDKHFATIIMMLSGVVRGLAVGVFLVENPELFSGTLEDIFLNIFFMYMILMLVIYLHTILHEFGHMIFGLLTGYEFISFRVGNLLLIKKDNKLQFKKYSLMGTGGQCLMSYPQYNKDNFPFVLYNLGGVIVNVVLSILFTIIYFLAKPQGMYAFFCVMMIAEGIANAIMNGIPFKNEYISNDAHNIVTLLKDKAAQKGFYSMLKVNEYQSKDISFSKMPKELFELEEGADLHNPFNSYLLICKEYMCLEESQFDKGKEYIDILLSDKCTLNGVHKNMIMLDSLYIDILNGKEADLSVVEEKKMKSFIKSMSNAPSIIRTQYALARYKNDEKKQKLFSERLDRISKDYPYENEINTERKLMDLIKNHA